MDFKFSIFIRQINENINKTVDSIINQSLSFRENVQIIVVYDNYIQENFDYYLKNYSENIYFINSKEFDELTSDSDLIKGEYINFLKEGYLLEHNFLEDCLSFFELNSDINLVSTDTNRKFKKTINYNYVKPEIFDVFINYYLIHLNLSSFIFNKKVIFEFPSYNNKINDLVWLSNLILINRKYGFIKSTYLVINNYFEWNFTDLNSLFNRFTDLNYYLQCLFINLLDSILNNYNNNLENNNKKIIENILKFIDDEIILSYDFSNIHLKYFILSLKSNFNIELYENNLFLKYKNILIKEINEVPIKINNLEIKNNVLYIRGNFDYYLNNSNFKIILTLNGIDFILENINDNQFNLTNIFNDFVFDTSLILNLINKISFKIIYNEIPISLKIDYSEVELVQLNISDYLINFSNNGFYLEKIIPKYINDNSFDKNEIFTLWISDDDTLPELSFLALKSMLLVGHKVILYTYSYLHNVPEGVKVLDANEILDSSKIFKYKNLHKTYSGFANWFRYKRLYEYGGTWLDLDIILIKNVNDVVSDDIAICSEPHINFYLHTNNAFLRFPKHDPCVKAMLDYSEERGDDVKHGETGPRLVIKMFNEKFPSYNRYLKPFNLNNFLGWRELNKFLKDSEFILHNIDMDEVFGFHFINTHFIKQRIGSRPSGLYNDLKHVILISNSKEEYINNLKKFNIIKNNCFVNNVKHWDIEYLEKLDNHNNLLFSFLIDSTKLTKLEIYNLLSSIEKLSIDSFEIILCGRVNISKDNIPLKKNLIYLNSNFSNIANELLNNIRGKYIIPINKGIIFSNSFLHDFDFTKDIYNYTFNTDMGKSEINIIKNSVFKELSSLYLDLVFDLPKKDIINYSILNVETDLIYGYSLENKGEEKLIISLIDLVESISYLNEQSFKILKNRISMLYKNDLVNNLSFYYVSKCNNILNSNSYLEFYSKDNFESLECLTAFYLKRIFND